MLDILVGKVVTSILFVEKRKEDQIDRYNLKERKGKEKTSLTHRVSLKLPGENSLYRSWTLSPHSTQQNIC